MAPKKIDVKQDDFFGTLDIPVVVDETKARKPLGGHVDKNKPPQRTAHEIQNPPNVPITRRITTENASDWANDH